MILSTILLTVICIFKGKRTKERCMIAFTSWAIIIAWVFIHLSLVINQLSFVGNTLNSAKEDAAIEYIIKDNHEGFIEFCSNREHSCYVTDKAGKTVMKTGQLNEKQIAERFLTTSRAKQFENYVDGKKINSLMVNNFFFEDSAISFNIISNGEATYIIHDDKDIVKTYYGIKFYIYYWYGIVLLSWVSIGGWTISSHRKKEAPNVKEEEEKDNVR